MKWSLVLVVCQLSTTVATTADPTEKLLQSIVVNGHKRVAVIPAVIVRNGDDENTIGSLGPRGRLMAEELYQKLIAASQGSHRGKFRVVPERVMRRGIKATNFGVKDLGDPKAIRRLAREVGADTLVTLTKDEQRDQYLADMIASQVSGAATDDGKSERVLEDNVTVESLDTGDGFSTSSNNFKDERTLSKAAYMGESWELRRWVDGELQSLAFDLPGNQAFGTGVRWEKYQYVSLRNKLPHPLEVDGFAYPVSILVDQAARKLERVEDADGTVRYVVALDPGEVYQVAVSNKGTQPVYMAVYVDGVNSIDKKRVEPGDLEDRRHWYVRPNKIQAPIRGWFEIPRDQYGRPQRVSQQYNEFKIAPRDESVGFGEGFDDVIGQITVIVYTNGVEGVDVPGDEELPVTGRGLPKASFGTGLGDKKDRKLNFIKGQGPGLMLAAVTIYYRTSDQLRSVLKGEAYDPVLTKNDEPQPGPERRTSETDLPEESSRSQPPAKRRSESDLPD